MYRRVIRVGLAGCLLGGCAAEDRGQASPVSLRSTSSLPVPRVSADSTVRVATPTT